MFLREECGTQRFTYVAPEKSVRIGRYPGVEHFTFEGYRDHIGEREFAIETNFETPLKL